MKPFPPKDPLPRSIYIIAAAVAAAHVALSFSPWYEMFRDEFYYLACAARLDAGYVDHPPLSVWLLAGVRAMLGDSVAAVRLLPALAAGATTAVAGMLARAMGAQRTGMVLAALFAAGVPILHALASFYSMNAFEPLLWGITLLCLFRALDRQRPRDWMWLGLLLGIGLMNKHTMILLPAALLPALLLTGQRRVLGTKGPWIAAAITCCIVLPNILWQWAYGFPSLEFYANATKYKNIPTSPLEMVFLQSMVGNIFFLPVWIAGVWWLFVHDNGRWRFLGWTVISTYLIFLATQSSRPDRIAGMYVLCAAAGGGALGAWLAHRAALARSGAIAAITLAGIAMLPLVLPLFPPVTQSRVMGLAGMNRQFEKDQRAPLPQHLADRFGWRDMAADIARACALLTPEERAVAAIGASNYGEAGALEYYREEYNLPPTLATHNSYFHWGPGDTSGEVMIMIGTSEEELHEMFEDVQNTWIIHWGGFAMGFENDLPIYICRRPRVPLKELWPKLKKYV